MCKSGQRPVSFAGTNKSKIPNSQIEDPELARYVDVLRRRLIQLPSRPTEPTATLTPLVQATRHELWRIKHSYDPDYAVRLIVWFDDTTDNALFSVLGGNKHPNHDHWYDRAVNEAEHAVDQIIRLRNARKEQS